MEEDRLITIAEAVIVTQFSRNTIMRRIKTGELVARPQKAGYKKGARVALKLSEVLLLLPEGEREAARARLG